MLTSVPTVRVTTGSRGGVARSGAWLLALALFSLPSPPYADAQEWPTKIVLHPAKAPQPLLKYQLLPTMDERRPGNAAVFYGRVKAEQTAFFTSKEIWQEINATEDAPLSRVAKMKHIRRHHDSSAIYSFIERAGQCEDCDWQYPIEEDGYHTLLPDAQERRELARLLRADIRWHVAHGDFDGALRSLKAGYAMARHTAHSPILVPALIGVAMSGVMSTCTLELIQQPDAPSLYWALTYLPEPFFDSRRIFEGEMRMHEAAFPQLLGSDWTNDDPAYWSRQVEGITEVYKRQICDSDAERAKFEGESAKRLLRVYPEAKRMLIGAGQDPQEVEAIPVGKAILLQAALVYGNLRDEALTCQAVPYWQAVPVIERYENHLNQAKGDSISIAPTLAGLPPIATALKALMRHDREIALLRTLEALRLYAGQKGTLPDHLDQIDLPLPIDPMTGRPFEYDLRDGVARISGPSVPGVPCDFEVRLATKDSE